MKTTPSLVIATGLMVIAGACGQWSVSGELGTRQPPPPSSSLWSMPARVVDGLEYGLATSGQDLHIVAGTRGSVTYRHGVADASTGNVAWDAPVSLSSSSDSFVALDRPISVVGQNAFVAYMKNETSFRDMCCERVTGDIYMRTVRRGVVGPEARLTTSQKALRVALAANGSTLFLVWSDFRSGKTWDLYCRFGTDDGASVTWGPETKLVSGMKAGANRPDALIASNGTVFAFWMDGRHSPSYSSCFGYGGCSELFEMHTADQSNWSEARDLFQSSLYLGRPIVTQTASGTLVLTWEQSDEKFSKNAIMISRSVDSGATWSTPDAVVSTSSSHSWVAGSGSTVVLAWHDFRFDARNANIYAKVSTNDGIAWGSEERVSNTPGNSVVPMLSTTHGFVHMIYGEFANRQEVWYSRRAIGNSVTGRGW